MTADDDDDSAARAESPPPLGQAWPCPQPPPGFEDRVLSAWQREQRTGKEGRASRIRSGSGRLSRRSIVVSVIGASVALVVVLAVRFGTAPVTGFLDTNTRQTIQVGTRARAVAEPGASIRWTVSRRTAEVEQKSGRVFYQVEKGGPFKVITQGGNISVLGTSFSVEVTDVNTLAKSTPTPRQLVVGGLLLTGVAVVVYAGRVLLDNEHGAVEVPAGAAGQATDRATPEVVAPAATEPTDPRHRATQISNLVADNLKLRLEMDALRAQLAQERQRQAALKEGTPAHDAGVAAPGLELTPQERAVLEAANERTEARGRQSSRELLADLKGTGTPGPGEMTKEEGLELFRITNGDWNSSRMRGETVWGGQVSELVRKHKRRLAQYWKGTLVNELPPERAREILQALREGKVSGLSLPRPPVMGENARGERFFFGWTDEDWR